MTELEQIQKHIDQRFDILQGTMTRIGSITDNNAKDIEGLKTTCQFLEKAIENQNKSKETQDVENLADFNRLYTGVSNRVKISTLLWVVGVAVTITGIASPIIHRMITK